MHKLPPNMALWLFSNGRKAFISMLANDKPNERIQISTSLTKKIWDITFCNPLFNAAGMFKNGEGYYTVASQKAGAYLAGTTTALSRTGNKKNNIKHPVLPLSKSGIGINWMGLPNQGHELIAFQLSKLEKQPGCPIGISISADPNLHGLDSLNGVLSGLKLYDEAMVDFIELNESCPNVQHDFSLETVKGLDKNLVERLEFISARFLKKRNRNLPLIVKFSVDTNPEQVPLLLDILIDLKFDGVNFGNTSIDYEYLRNDINPNDIKLFDYFTSNFGGGVSGKLLKSKSYSLSSLAVNMINILQPAHEFHVIRTGGISSADDILLSEKSGISLNQWFTGYFEVFAAKGHRLYQMIFNDIYNIK